MMTPPLPLKLTRAEVRMAGTRVTVSAHGLSIPTELDKTLADAMWAQVGARPGQVAMTLQGDMAGAELIRLSDRSRGMRVWIGPMSFRRPLLERYWDALHHMELQARNFAREMEVADVA